MVKQKKKITFYNELTEPLKLCFISLLLNACASVSSPIQEVSWHITSSS